MFRTKCSLMGENIIVLNAPFGNFPSALVAEAVILMIHSLKTRTARIFVKVAILIRTLNAQSVELSISILSSIGQREGSSSVRNAERPADFVLFLLKTRCGISKHTSGDKIKPGRFLPGFYFFIGGPNEELIDVARNLFCEIRSRGASKAP